MVSPNQATPRQTTLDMEATLMLLILGLTITTWLAIILLIIVIVFVARHYL